MTGSSPKSPNGFARTPEGAVSPDGSGHGPAGVEGVMPRRALEVALTEGSDGAISAISEARRAKGYSYRTLAKKISVSSATLQGWLTGKYMPQLSMHAEFTRMVEALGLVDPEGTPSGISADDWWEAVRVLPSVKKQLPSPYPGMRPYDFSMAASFVGREGIVDLLHRRITERLVGSQRPLLLITGRSGVGKSSVVAAAVGTLPSEAVRELVSPSAAAVDALERVADGRCDVLVIDHAETLWSAVPASVRDDVLELITRIDTGRRKAAIILVLRADAVAPATDVGVLRRALEESPIVVGPVTEEDAARIITEPPTSQGIHVESGLAEIILRDAGATGRQPDRTGGRQLVGVLPLLSQTMRTLWLHRRSPEWITVADYQRAGGIASSVEAGAEAAFEALSQSAQVMVWPVLREMIRLDTPIPTRRSVPLSTFEGDDFQEVLREFLDARLLSSGDDSVTLSHDLLLTSWPRLGGWLETAKEWSAARRLLSRFASFWDESGRPDDLLTSRTAAVLLETSDHDAHNLASELEYTKIEQEFLEVSREAQNAALRAAERDNDHLRASRRRFGAAAVAASLLLVVSMIAGGSALFANTKLAEARAVALSGQIAARSETVSQTMPSEAAQLAVGAFRLDDNDTTLSRLLSLSAAPLPRRITTAAGPGSVDAVNDLLVKGGTDGEILLLDSSTGEQHGAIESPASHIYATSIVDTGERLLLAASGEDSASADGSSDGCTWDISAEPRLLGCVRLPAKSDAVAVLEDGSGVLFGTGDGMVHRQSIEGDSISELPPIPGPAPDPSAPPTAVQGLDAAGGAVLIGAYDGTVGLLSDPLGDATYSATEQLPGLLSLSVSHDGTRFVGSTRENLLVIGDLSNNAITPTATSPIFESWVNQAVILPDGRVAAVSSDQTLRLIGPDGTEQHVQETPAILTAVAVIGNSLATYSVDGVVTLWPADSFAAPSTRGRIFEIVADAHGKEITASLGEDDGVLHVERLGPNGVSVPIQVPEIEARTSYGIAISPDGEQVVTGGWEGDVYLWRVGEKALSEPTRFTPMPAGSLITYLKFSPGGTRLAVAAQNHDEVLVMDVSRPDGGDHPGGDTELLLTIPVTAGGTMTFLDDDTLVLDNGRSGLEVWDVSAGKKLSEVTVDGGRPSFVVARPGHPGQIGFATSSLSAGILDLTDPTSPETLSMVSGLADTPLSLAFSNDGARLAIAAVSHAQVRDVSEDGREISEPQMRLSGPVRSHITDVRFLEDSTRLAASTYSGRIWRWDLDAERAAATICSLTGTPLSEKEALELAPSLPEGSVLCS